MKDAVAELSMKSISQTIGAERPLGANSLPLNSVFGSYGEALHSWLSSGGFEGEKKMPNDLMITSFCHALQIQYFSFNTANQLQTYEYFEDVDWAVEWLDGQGFVIQFPGAYLFIDEGNRPIARVVFSQTATRNFNLAFCGDIRIGKALRDEVRKHVRVDEIDRNRPSYLEVVLLKKPNGDRDPELLQIDVQNTRKVVPEFYPYLDGGASGLIADFLESEDGALILMGPAGTGKSSAISAAILDLNLIPIYVKSTEVAEHHDFVNFVMRVSDERMRKAQEGDKGRSILFKQNFSDHRFLELNQMINRQPADTRIPVIVVEDAGALISPIKEGNKLMSNLLNELDGLGSSLSRKIIFTTNLMSTKSIDEALLRPGRCYDAVMFHLLTPAQAVTARRAAGLPDFEVLPTKDISLAEAVRKPRKKISIERARNKIGFCG